jgi:hypothetical protein
MESKNEVRAIVPDFFLSIEKRKIYFAVHTKKFWAA